MSEARKAREAEIAAFAAEMRTTEPKFTPAVIKPNWMSGLHVSEAVDLDGATLAEEEAEEEETNRISEAYSDVNESAEAEYYVPAAIQSHNVSEVVAEGDDIEAVALEKKIPISHQIDLVGHTKAVMCISIEPAGNRLVTGSLDYNAKLYDFGGMDSRHRAFKSIEIEEGHPVTSVSHSPSGDKFVVSTGSAQPHVYDRDGGEIIKFVKGDMYLRDAANTKGHVMEVTCVRWHPIEKNIILTSSLDGTMRIWDLLGEATFGALINKSVLKIRGAVGQGRTACYSCVYTHNGGRIYGGTSDSNIHMWIAKTGKQTYSKADAIFSMPESCKSPVMSLSISQDNSRLAARVEGGAVSLWDITKPQGGAVLLTVILDINNTYSAASVDFSPDGGVLVAGTSPLREDTSTKSHILFFDISKIRAPPVKGTKSMGVGEVSSPPIPFLRIGATTGASVVAIRWQSSTKQLFYSLSSGIVRVLFDPRMSVKGAMLTAGRAPRREKDPSDFALVGDIITPHALPLFRDEEKDLGKKRYLERKDPVKSKMPVKDTKAFGKQPNNSFFFTKFVMENRSVDNMRTEDPREALLKLDEKAKADPQFLGRAYQETQPTTQLYKMTFEEEQEEFKKKQKKVIE